MGLVHEVFPIQIRQIGLIFLPNKHKLPNVAKLLSALNYILILILNLILVNCTHVYINLVYFHGF